MDVPARCRGSAFTTYQRVSCHQRNKKEPHARTFRPRRIILSPISGCLRACVRVRTKVRGRGQDTYKGRASESVNLDTS
jgi:hypothetical protein